MSVKSKSRKTSFVWNYFQVCEKDPAKAICKNCGIVRIRGKDTRHYSTSSLAAHIKSCAKRRRLQNAGLLPLPNGSQSDETEEFHNPFQSGSRKTSFVWNYFRICKDDERKAVCKKCGTIRMRGKNTRHYSTSSLAAHVRVCGKSKSKRYHSLNTSTPVIKDRPQLDESQEISQLFQEYNNYQTQEIKTETGDFEEYVLPDPRCDASKDVICSKQIDVIHSGLIMNTLYQQHRYGRFCDLTLISAPAEQTSTVAESPSIVASKMSNSGRKIFKAHSPVLAAVSNKVKTLIEMGSRTIELKDVSPFGLKSLLEIVYTGKLQKSTIFRYNQVHQIWKAARDLGINYVRNYLQQHHPQATKWILDEEERIASDQSMLEYREGGLDDAEEDDLVDMCTGVVDEQQAQHESEAEESSEIHYEDFTEEPPLQDVKEQVVEIRFTK